MICFAVDGGRKILSPVYQKKKEIDILPAKEEDLKEQIHNVCNRYIFLVEQARNSAEKYNKIPPIPMKNGIVCTQIGKNFFRYSRENLFMTVYQENSFEENEFESDDYEDNVLEGDEDKISFYYVLYKKTYNNSISGGIVYNEHSHLLLPELVLRAR